MHDNTMTEADTEFWRCAENLRDVTLIRFGCAHTVEIRCAVVLPLEIARGADMVPCYWCQTKAERPWAFTDEDELASLHDHHFHGTWQGAPTVMRLAKYTLEDVASMRLWDLELVPATPEVPSAEA